MRTLIGIILIVFAVACSDQSNIHRPNSYNFQRGREAYRNDNYEEALEYLNKEVDDNPKNGYAFLVIAEIRSEQKEYGLALTAVDLALKHIPKRDKIYVYTAFKSRAQIYCDLGDTIKSIADYSKAIKIDPDKAEAYQERAQIYYEQEKYDLSDADYRHLIQLDEGGTIGYMGIGRNNIKREMWDAAIEKFDYVIKLCSDFSQAYAFRAECYLGKEDWDKATDDIVTALKIDGNDKAFYLMQILGDVPFMNLKAKFQIQAVKEVNEEKWPYYLGIIHERKKLHDQAIIFYEEANRRNKDVYTYERIANCYEKEEQYENCIKAIDKALNMEPQRASILAMKANVLFGMGRTREAITAWNEIISADPDAVGYFYRGCCREYSDAEGAIEDFTMSIILNPSNAAYLHRGNLYNQLGKWDLARADYEKIIELEQSADDYETVQYAYQSLGNYDKAIEVMNAIIERDPSDKGVYYDAACLYSRMNMIEKALAYLEKALQMGYRSFVHMSRDYDIDAIREMPEYKALIQKYRNSHKDIISQVNTTCHTEKERVVHVPFSRENGSSLCNVRCTINDLPLYFIFDTGASEVSISQVEATFMMKNGYLSKNDVVGNAYFTDAVGNVNVGTVINLKKVNFGGLELSNVRASVVRNQKAPLLLGQSVLGRLGRIEIDNNNQVLRISQRE